MANIRTAYVVAHNTIASMTRRPERGETRHVDTEKRDALGPVDPVPIGGGRSAHESSEFTLRLPLLRLRFRDPLALE